jgi:hypothetical protein
MSSSFDDITKKGINQHQKKVDFSKKVKVLSKRLDPIVKKILREVGDAQSKWMRETKREPWNNIKPSSLPLILDLARFFYAETTHGKYRYEINGYFGLGPPYQSYYWRLKWIRSFSFSTDWGITLRVQDKVDPFVKTNTKKINVRLLSLRLLT